MPDIGSVALSNNIVAAPLSGISDYPFRQLCRDFGIGLTVTEMISSVGVFRGDKKSKTFTFVKHEHPISVQIFGSDPDMMAYTAAHFEAEGADIIDINFGCPVRKVLRQGAGSALQKDLIMAARAISFVRKALSIPLTIKMRLGWSSGQENYIELAHIAENEGVNAICLHPRYAVQQYQGHADWTKFHSLRSRCKLPLIGSGDLVTPSDLSHALSTFPIDFLMVGRGLLGNPWLVSAFLNGPQPSLKQTLLTHFDYLMDYHGEHKASRLFRKFIGKYVKGLPNAQAIRQGGNQLSSRQDLLNLLKYIHAEHRPL